MVESSVNLASARSLIQTYFTSEDQVPASRRGALRQSLSTPKITSTKHHGHTESLTASG
jgi:hypothetical protein